jgi:beta-lactamase superfamily II metal-dependent hydrolase
MSGALWSHWWDGSVGGERGASRLMPVLLVQASGQTVLYSDNGRQEEELVCEGGSPLHGSQVLVSQHLGSHCSVLLHFTLEAL